MKGGRNNASFLLGTGVEPPQPETRCCSACGFETPNHKLLKRDGEGGHTCTTGHYEDGEGNLKRARNPYARR